MKKFYISSIVVEVTLLSIAAIWTLFKVCRGSDVPSLLFAVMGVLVGGIYKDLRDIKKREERK